MVNLLVCSGIVSACHYICHRVVIVITEWSIDAYMMTTGSHALRNLVLVNTRSGSKFFNAWTTLVFLLKLINFLVYLIE